MELQIIQRPLFFEAIGRELARKLNEASRFTHMKFLSQPRSVTGSHRLKLKSGLSRYISSP